MPPSTTSTRVGAAMIRGVARKVDASAFSQRGGDRHRSGRFAARYTLPASAATAPDIAGIITAVSEISGEGGVANAAFMNPADIGGRAGRGRDGRLLSLSDPTAPERQSDRRGGALPGAASAGTADRGRRPLHRGGDPARRLGGLLRARRVHEGRQSSARVTMRVDWAPSDLSAFRLII